MYSLSLSVAEILVECVGSELIVSDEICVGISSAKVWDKEVNSGVSVKENVADD